MQWPLAKKIAFRFLFLYLILFELLLPFAAPLVVWMGTRIGVDASVRMNGSGDTTHHYVQALGAFLIAMAGALAWSAIDRKRPNQRQLYLGFRVLVRLLLAVTLIQYGSVKVFQSQFPPPSVHRLTETFGDASPMGLLWTFMGASAPYNTITGGVELLGGLLLFFRRTTLLGSLIAIVAMAQVCALNFCYDVPVKLHSLHLLGMAIFLAGEDASRLAALFFFNRPVAPGGMETVLQRPIGLRSAFALKLVFLSLVLGFGLYNAHGSQAKRISGREGVDPSKYPLLNRGFHWINEAPYNR